MVLYKMKDCLRSFYYEVYSGATNCTKLYNYTSSDMNTRKNAFTSGKECFLSFTNLWCSPESNKYLKQSYDKLVNYLTIDNDGPDQCNSLYDELNSYQCIGYQYAVSFLERELEKAKLMKKPYEKNETEPMLEETRKCYRKYCKYTYEQYEYLNKLSEDIVNYNSDYPLAPKTLSEFDRCIEYILQNIDADKYKCIRKTPQKSGTVDENAPTVKLTGFLRDKECMKLVMTQECWMSLTIFEEGWEATRHQMKTLWKELIDEFIFFMFNFQMLLLLSLLLFYNYQPLEAKQEYRRLLTARFPTRSLDCPALESIISIATCSEYVFELSKYTDQSFLTTVSLEYARNVTRMCNEMNKDPEAKKTAWTSGKACAQTFLNSNCSEKPRAYFKNHYDKLVELLTVDSDTEFYCGSFHDELIAMLCERKTYEFKLAHEEWVIAQREGYAYTRNDSEITPMYRDVFNCMNEFCYFSDQQIRKLTREYEEMMKTINWRDESSAAVPRNQTQFEKCLVMIVQNVNISKYSCVEEIPKSEEWTKGAGIINAPKTNLANFLNDKECMKSVMKKECGWLTYETFDADFEKLQKEMNSAGENLSQKELSVWDIDAMFGSAP
ncbi:Protein CBG17018 [Caenorhabditis briggsae]|uniref:Protein CBG17018 n=1 Tax=Caenorhabditis briggsae TaxID=6238 RepID=A8XQA0_CAEBR|nr:Protein CBG17018 [Caenorhabditis briggsae]CAP34826.2 Protein CBG17018 [Caenorhabditis briggsae]